MNLNSLTVCCRKFVEGFAGSLALLVLVGSGPLAAQDASSEPAGPTMEIAVATDEESTTAPPGGLLPGVLESVASPEVLGLTEGMFEEEIGGEPPAEAALPNRYLYTTLRVVNSGSTRGCGYANWSCMTGLCRNDLGSSAWRGWAGCHKSGSSWLCVFECGLVRNTY